MNCTPYERTLSLEQTDSLCHVHSRRRVLSRLTLLHSIPASTLSASLSHQTPLSHSLPLRLPPSPSLSSRPPSLSARNLSDSLALFLTPSISHLLPHARRASPSLRRKSRLLSSLPQPTSISHPRRRPSPSPPAPLPISPSFPVSTPHPQQTPLTFSSSGSDVSSGGHVHSRRRVLSRLTLLHSIPTSTLLASLSHQTPLSHSLPLRLPPSPSLSGRPPSLSARNLSDSLALSLTPSISISSLMLGEHRPLFVGSRARCRLFLNRRQSPIHVDAPLLLLQRRFPSPHLSLRRPLIRSRRPSPSPPLAATSLLVGDVLELSRPKH